LPQEKNIAVLYLSPLFPLSTFVERGIGGEVSKMSLSLTLKPVLVTENSIH
jgi:hypothetical protein